jgi:hypothetical protein
MKSDGTWSDVADGPPVFRAKNRYVTFQALLGKNIFHPFLVAFFIFWKKNGTLHVFPRKIKAGIPGKRSVMDFCEDGAPFCRDFGANCVCNNLITSGF